MTIIKKFKGELLSNQVHVHCMTVHYMWKCWNRWLLYFYMQTIQQKLLLYLCLIYFLASDQFYHCLCRNIVTESLMDFTAASWVLSLCQMLACGGTKPNLGCFCFFFLISQNQISQANGNNIQTDVEVSTKPGKSTCLSCNNHKSGWA